MDKQPFITHFHFFTMVIHNYIQICVNPGAKLSKKKICFHNINSPLEKVLNIQYNAMRFNGAFSNSIVHNSQSRNRKNL